MNRGGSLRHSGKGNGQFCGQASTDVERRVETTIYSNSLTRVQHTIQFGYDKPKQCLNETLLISKVGICHLSSASASDYRRRLRGQNVLPRFQEND